MLPVDIEIGSMITALRSNTNIVLLFSLSLIFLGFVINIFISFYILELCIFLCKDKSNALQTCDILWTKIFYCMLVKKLFNENCV